MWNLFVRASGCCLGMETEGEEKGAGQHSVASLGATWSAWFFPMFPSLHSVMNGFLLVCGRGPGLKSILTKAQNTHPSQPASQPPCVLASEHSQPAVHLLQTGSVTHCHIGCNDMILNGKHTSKSFMSILHNTQLLQVFTCHFR